MIITNRRQIVFILIQLCFCKSQAQENINVQHLSKKFTYASQFQFDTLGYLWIANFDGLYKYDGYEYEFTPNSKIYSEPTNSSSELLFEKDESGYFWLSNAADGLVRFDYNGNFDSFEERIDGRVLAILPTKHKVLFATDKGLIYTYEQRSDSIRTLTELPQKGKENIAIQNLAMTKDSLLWIGTRTGEIYSKALLRPYSAWQELKGPHIHPYEPGAKIVSDGTKFLYIAAENLGLFSYNIKTDIFTKLQPTETYRTSEDKPLFLSLYYDESNKKVWAGTDGNGLYRYDIQSDELTIMHHKRSNNGTISNNTIGEIASDKHKNIWIATKNGVIDILPHQSNEIGYYSASENGAANSVLSVLVGKDGSIWMGTDGEGVHRILPNGRSLQYNNNKNDANTFEGRYVQSLAEDARGQIWLGTYRNGLYVYNPKSDTFTKKNIMDRNGNSISDIRTVFVDSKQRIWVSSIAGLHLLSKTGAVLALYEYGSNGIYGSISETITETPDGTIWAGVTDSGLFKYHENSGKISDAAFQNVKCNDGGDNLRRGVNFIIPDASNNLYIKTVTGNIVYYNADTKTCNLILEKQNSTNILAQSMALDKSGLLWMGTMNGLFSYDISNRTINSYFLGDGLQGDSFRRGVFKSNEGKLFFGGLNGLSSFFPGDLKQRVVNPKLYIKNINLLNKPATDLIPEQFTDGIANVEKLELSHNQSSFSFEFSVIDDLLNTNFNYAYRLKGFDADWINAKTQRTAVYTNVPTGEYVFEVKAGTNEKVRGIEPTSIRIIVAPPWWLSMWAYIIYFLILCALVFGAYRWIQLRSKLKMEEWTYQNEKEVYNTKMNFFAKMSHEIQTPLSLILGPIEDMLYKAKSNEDRLLVQRLNLIKNNAKRLSRISIELTTIRDKELHRLKLKVTKRNIVDDLKIIALSFSEQARFKKIDFIQEFSKDRINLWYDKDKLEHVFYNLLSNAFKFTPQDGTIYLKVVEDTSKQKVKISVIDSGPGIEKSDLKDIFSMFYQSKAGKKIKGSGIGLALTKELVELHHGKIRAKSSKSQGSSFHIILSTEEDIFSDDDKLNSTLGLDEITTDVKEQLLDSSMPNEVHLYNDGPKRHILIVEDNVEMQIFLKELLAPTYRIGVAENGRASLDYLETDTPDLIISDIMMPVMDGIEMGNALRRNKKWSHIPLILITARNSTKSRLTGFESGAVAYLNKPFQPKELLLRINGLLRHKTDIVAFAKTNFITNKDAALPPSKNHLFLDRLVDSLHEHMTDQNFKLESLTDILGMSYSVILRNCQEILGKTLVELFRKLKMKKAALLILEQGFNVTEAGYAVGYRDTKYFSKCFKDEFGVPPQTMKAESRNRGVEQVITEYRLKHNT